MPFIGEDNFRWSLQEFNSWKVSLKKVRGRQTFPRFLVLKRLGVPADGSPSKELSTVDFHNATVELFGIADALEASATGVSSSALYLNPFTGDYPSADPASDWAIGTLWTRAYDPISYTAAVGGQQRRYAFVSDYLDRVAKPLDGKIPLLPLSIFLARTSPAWLMDSTGITSLDNLVERVVDRLGLTQAELAILFEPNGDTSAPLANKPLAAKAAFKLALKEMPPQKSAAQTGPASPATAQAVAPTAKWDALVEDDDACGLRGLGPALRRAYRALAAGKHVILYGPPGTGKSQLAECLCKRANVQSVLTTATSDWTTFDTIGGYFPSGGSSADLKFQPGLIVEAIQNGRWIIVDEINRADIDKAFGQLFSILAGQAITLPFFQHAQPARITIGPADPIKQPTIIVPPDWRMIGTMNTFDKATLFQLSYALMRRFAFIEVPAPDGTLMAEIVGSAIDAWPKDGREDYGERLIQLFCSEAGLRSTGLEVGAAIPLDVCRAMAAAHVDEIDHAYVVDLLDMHLFPQFEGRERDHQKIASALRTTLDLDEGLFATAQRKLGGWTGYR